MIYKEEYKKLHEEGNFNGGSLKPEYINIISEMVESTASTSILDYGCGKAQNYLKNKIHNRFGIPDSGLFLYDPGVPKFSKLMKDTVDGVICTDVLEHIPEEELEETFQTIFKKAEKFVFLVVFCGLAVKTFPDGTNVHVTIKPPIWWEEQIKKYNINNVKVKTKYLIPVRDESNILNLTMKDTLI